MNRPYMRFLAIFDILHKCVSLLQIGAAMEFVLLALLVAGGITYTANVQQVTKRGIWIRVLLLILSTLGIVMGAYVVLIATGADAMQSAPPDTLTPEQRETLAALGQIPISTALAYLGLCLALGGLSIAVIISRSLRLWIARVAVRSDEVNRRYDPDAIVHTTAIVLALFQIINLLGGFVVAGGIEGLAAELQANELTMDALLGGLLTNVLLALLGVGLFIRRDVPQTLQRLGLDSIQPRRLIIGAGIGFALFWAVFGLSWLLSLVVGPEALAEQSAAAEQIFLAFSGSLFAAFMLAATAAIGEEILFRGALQPIFGMVWTSLFFVLLHTQYTLTPAVLVLFAVSLVFGWLRRRFDTTAAMSAHFVYNFVPFILYWAASFVPVESWIR